jgi:hypothetical protein
MSAIVGIVLQNSFWVTEDKFSEPWVWRSNNYVGTTPPCVKLTGDSGNEFEAALIGDCRLFRLFAENYSHSVLGLLQHYRG